MLARCSSLTLHVEHVSDVVDVTDGDLRRPARLPRRLADMSATLNPNDHAGFVVSARHIRPIGYVDIT